jgi:hypothetical protein
MQHLSPSLLEAGILMLVGSDDTQENAGSGPELQVI